MLTYETYLAVVPLLQLVIPYTHYILCVSLSVWRIIACAVTCICAKLTAYQQRPYTPCSVVSRCLLGTVYLREPPQYGWALTTVFFILQPWSAKEACGHASVLC